MREITPENKLTKQCVSFSTLYQKTLIVLIVDLLHTGVCACNALTAL